MDEAAWSYYGTMIGNTPIATIGEFLVEEIYRKILDKHELELIEDQKVLIDDLKKSFSLEIREFKLSVSRLSSKFVKMEKMLDQLKKEKEKENAASKGKESKKPERVLNQCKKRDGGWKAAEASSSDCV